MAQSTSQAEKKVVLDATHEELGGRMVPFAGYALPVQYPSGIIAEHNWTRTHAGLFDVSHMGPAHIALTAPTGDAEADHAAVAALIEPLISGDIARLKPGQIRYTLLLNDQGGILDDLMVARDPDPETGGRLYVVVNAGTKENDFALIAAALGTAATLKRADDGALLALQGPEAVATIADLLPSVEDLGFMTHGVADWDGVPLTIARSGYTGEDGVEILVPAGKAKALWDRLTADERVQPAGLGARDSLRLEAGLPLYGHDLNETTSPIEAGLGFALSKRRREAADFPGAPRILAERENGPVRIRVGLFVDGAPAREGAEILNEAGEKVGVVTSGGFSPTLERAIALGFVPPALATPGQKLGVSVRGRTRSATVADLPFVPHRYHRKKS